MVRKPWQFGTREIDLASQIPAQKCAPEGVLPERQGGEQILFFGQEVE